LLSPDGIIVPKYLFTISGYFKSASSIPQNIIPFFSKLFFKLPYTTSDSYCAFTPPKYFFSASGIPILS